MLQDSDLQTFVKLVQRAKCDVNPPTGRRPGSTLYAEKNPNDLIHRNEYGQLIQSLKIACAAGDISDSPHHILYTISQDLSASDFCYLPLTYSEPWLDAIRWAISNPKSLPTDRSLHGGRDRQIVVGIACRALRDQGYEVHIGAHGPRIDDSVRTKISQRIDTLMAQLGGIDAINRLSRITCKTGNMYDGIWLFGNRPVKIEQQLEPAVPLGWLLSIALRHIHVKPSTDNPAHTWNAAVRLAIDFAATMDCQRYNLFDGLHLHATDFFRTLGASLIWRELFTLPQVPPMVLPILRSAFAEINWPPGYEELRMDADRLFCELNHLLSHLSDTHLSRISQSSAKSDYPYIWNCARAPRGGVNTQYIDPFGEYARNHDRFVFFEATDDHMVVLPRAMTSAAGCEAIFRLVWKRAKEHAGDIVGAIVTKAVAIACQRDTPCVLENEQYLSATGTRLELDVAVRTDRQIVLFETKAKSLTSTARIGDLMAFLKDYTKSFMAMLRQLVRHERNIRLGLTSLNSSDEDSHSLQIRKVAVSPLSYGPVNDPVLSRSLFQSIYEARFDSKNGTKDHISILDALNDSINRIREDIEQVAPHKDGHIDLFRYMCDVYWYDLGQLLYVLRRGRSLADGVFALGHLTARTQDFWTEAALAERRSLTDSKWHPLTSHTAADT